jgi:glycolate dehydrogenase FAD-binding subunit
MLAMPAKPATLEQLCEAVCAAPQVQPVGSGTKTALSAPLRGVSQIDMTGLTGVIEYEPGEYTFTAYAGTRVSLIEEVLGEHGQFLPFDPPLVRAGATLGGTVASGLSGPGRYRYGGVRDFILGVRYVDGQGKIIKGGGKVVKNAAGFDIPKLMAGSLGMLGVLAEITFKVFPAPRAYATLVVPCIDPHDATEVMHKVNASSMDIHALDLVPGGPHCYAVWARLSGLADALPERLERLAGVLGRGTTVEGEQDAALWEEVQELRWAPRPWALIKIPITPRRAPDVEAAFQQLDPGALRRYSGGGQVAWVATNAGIPAIDATLRNRELAGLVVMGPGAKVRLGVAVGQPFEERVRYAMDENGRFPPR